MSLRGILLIIILVPSLPFCLARPFYGIILWTIISFTSLQWYTYSAYEIPWALVIALPTIAGFFLFTRGWSRLGSRETLMLALLWAWFAVTTMISLNTPLFQHHADDTTDHLIFVSKIIFMTFVTIGILDSFGRLRTLCIVIAVCFGAFVVKTLPFLILTGGGDRVYGPEKSMIADNNDFGLALNMTLPMFFYLARSETRIWAKRLFFGLFLATIPAICFTYSRGALVGLLAVVALIFLRSNKRILFIPALLVGLTLAVVFAPEAWKERMNPTREGAVDNSAWSRINAWTFSWNLAMEYPVAGGGFSTFTRTLFDRYAPNARDVHGPHSIYFGILAEHGFVGLFLFLALIMFCWGATVQTAKWARIMGDEVALNYALMFQLSLAGFLTSGLFLGRQYFDYLYTVLACIVALRKVCFEKWSNPAVEEPAEGEEIVSSDLAEAL